MLKGRSSVVKECPANKGVGKKDIFESLINELSDKEEAQGVIPILVKYSDVFSKDRDDIGHFKNFKHDIEVYRKRPVYSRPYKIPHAIEAEVESKILQLVENGILKECSSPWNFPLIPIRKKTGDIRLCVDFRRLNEITVKKVFPLPDHQQIIDCLEGAKYFSTLDLSQGYYQISVDEADQSKCAFTTKSGQYCFTRMAFGLTNAPCSFQRALNSVMRSVNWKKCVIFMDDILIFGRTIKEHNEHLESVLELLRNGNLKAMPTKCDFLKKEVRFLGHIISQQGVKTDPNKIQAMQNMKDPTNAKQLRKFLGSCSYYRRFVKDFSRIAYPLYELTSPKKDFKWTEEHKKAFRELKEKMSSPPVLSFPAKKGKFILYTDASDYAIGSVLCQIQDNIERVIAYGSRKLAASEINYSVTKKELLAMVVFTRQFKHYLWGVEFEIRTDHKSLQYVLRGKNDTSSQFCRWRAELEMYNFQIKYIKGTDNVIADVMSRLPETSIETNYEIDITENLYDDHIRTVMKLLQQKRLNEKNPKELLNKNFEAKILWARREELLIRDSKLYLMKSNECERYVVPTKDREQTVRTYHENHSHIGIQKTLSMLKTRFFWPRMEETVNIIINSCRACSFNKQKMTRDKAPLVSTQVGEPFERIAMDLTGPFQLTTTGNRYILGIIDHFTKMCMLIPIRNGEAKTVCKAFFESWVSLFGAPVEIISDNGSSFKNNLKTEFAKLLGIKEIFSMPYYPQANGLVERLFRTAKTMIKTTVNDNKKEWDEVLPVVNMALMNSVAQSTKYAPYEVIFGKRARLPLDWQFPGITSNQQYHTENDYIIDLRRKLNEISEKVRKNLDMSIMRQADYYNKNKLYQNVKVGDSVLIRQTRNGKGLKKCRYDGPYIVIKKFGEWTYELQNQETKEIIRRSYNQIKILSKAEDMMNEVRQEKVVRDKPKINLQQESDNPMNEKAPLTEENVEKEIAQDEAPTHDELTNHRPILRRSTRERKQPNRLGFQKVPADNFYR